jgi:hypothetical protein
MAFWILVASFFLEDVWANDHSRNCEAEFPAAKLIDRRDPIYSVVQKCLDENKVQHWGRIFGVTLVLGVASTLGIQAGKADGEEV